MREFDFDYPLDISQQALCGVDPPEAYCGDGINGPGELCDGSDIGDLTYDDFGLDEGERYLACTGD